MRLDIAFKTEDEAIPVYMSECGEGIDVQFGSINIITDPYDVDPYTGSYVVTPKLEEQSLATAAKFLNKNVRVLEIPYSAVSNESGGITATIGGI